MIRPRPFPPRRAPGWAAVLITLLLAACAHAPAARAPQFYVTPGLDAPEPPPSVSRVRPKRAPRVGNDEPPLALALAPVKRASSSAAKPRGAPRLAWPTDVGKVSSPYGRRGRRHHDGIDISVPYGTPVYAAADGEVVYVGSLRGYGRMVIIRHGNGFVTVYAHNARHEVREGARVRRGALVARVGRTGRTTGVVLHFEVRKDNVAYDPIGFLPPRSDVAAREE
ncbi:MAG: M23 family metallopeptidase [Deltaproteobacteria bacterium]|nr:M23 family metallopeptidase [Deltaproteobacteria bacterium]